VEVEVAVDMTLTVEQERFIAGFRCYLDGLDLDLAAVRAEFESDPMQIVGVAREFVRRLGHDGWLGVGWPVEHGGGGRSAVEQWLFLEELAHRRLPSGNLTTSSLGPTLARVGTEQQRAAFLPGILAGDIDFAIGYSEPEAGTDLASLTTRAVRRGDSYLVNGQKIYTTGAHVATHLWLAARTGTREDRHRGLTLLIIPLPTPGVQITPIMTQGDERTNQVFLTDVEVPATALVGEENGGWSVITTQLNFERLFCYSDLSHQFELVLDWARASGAFELSPVRVSLAELAADLEVCRLFSMRAAWLLDHDRVPVAEASMNKIWYSELRQRLSVVALDIMGPLGQLRGGHPLAPLDGRMERAYRASTVIKFGAGTNEVQRDIIAQRGLGAGAGGRGKVR
jgi:3-oxocholest-4-en-26-oyl-CoA dehydrogenase alpha subunit